MPFATAQELVAASAKGKFYPRVNTIEEAESVLARELERTLNNQQNDKDNRPWHIVDMSKLLPADEAWVGFEFETGFDSQKDYRSFINFLWEQDHVAIDREGTGNFPVEVAFPPQALSEVLNGEALLVRTLQFVEENGLVPALNPTTYTRRDVGIHAGISTPTFRKATDAARRNAVQRLDDELLRLDDDQRVAVYGRCQLHWGGANSRGSYAEVKVFRAVPTVEHAVKVAAVTARIVGLLDFCLINPNKRPNNTFEYLSGQADALTGA